MRTNRLVAALVGLAGVAGCAAEYGAGYYPADVTVSYGASYPGYYGSPYYYHRPYYQTPYSYQAPYSYRAPYSYQAPYSSVRPPPAYGGGYASPGDGRGDGYPGYGRGNTFGRPYAGHFGYRR